MHGMMCSICGEYCGTEWTIYDGSIMHPKCIPSNTTKKQKYLSTPKWISGPNYQNTYEEGYYEQCYRASRIFNVFDNGLKKERDE